MRVIIDGRVFERVEGELSVKYSSQGSDKEVCTTAKNISGGGVRMSLLERMDPGTVLDLEIYRTCPTEGFGAGSIYNTDIKVKCRGKIVWIWDKSIDEENERFFEAGVQFIDWRLLSIGGLIGWLKESKREISKI